MAPLPLDFPRLVATYLPSPSDDDDDDEADYLHPSPDAPDDSPDSLDSLDDWSDDPPDSAPASDLSSDSDDPSPAAWSSSKSNKHHHLHHQHHNKNNSFNSACDYLSFFAALRKGFCSRPLDQRIEFYNSHRRADKATLPGGGDLLQQEKSRVNKAGTGGVSGGAFRHRDSEGYTRKDHEGASSFSAMFKCTVADTPKNLLKRASLIENSDDQDIYAHKAGAENVSEKDVREIEKETRQKAERITAPEVTMVTERDGRGISKKDGPRSRENLCKDMAHKEYGEAHVEVGTNPLLNVSKLSDENSNVEEDDQLSKHNKASDEQSCWRESGHRGLPNKGDWKHAMPDCSNKSAKNHSQVALMVNTLEPKVEGGVSLENNAIQQSKDSQGNTTSSGDNSYEDKKLEASADKAKLDDMSLHIYKKEKHPPELVFKDPKRKTKAKKVKASKGKKLHLFRDGFTLPSLTEPVEDAESAPFMLNRQFEASNKVQSPNAAVKNPISKEFLLASGPEGDKQPPVIGNAMAVVDGVPLRNVTRPGATSKPCAIPVHSIKAQVGNSTSNDSGHAVVALPDSASKGLLYSSASHQSIDDSDGLKTSLAEGRFAALSNEPESKLESFGNIQDNLVSTGNIISSTSPDPLSYTETPSYHLENNIAPPAIVASSTRVPSMDTSNTQCPGFVSQSQAYSSNSVLLQEISPPALFHVDSRALYERKNKSRHSWVPSATNTVSSNTSSAQDRLAEVMGQGSSVTSASPALLAIDEVSKDCWSPLSSSLSVTVPESDHPRKLFAHEPDSLLLPGQVFPFPAASIIDGKGPKSGWPEVAQSGFTRKLPEQGIAPSPMALWPHLFPKASSADNIMESFAQMETREGINAQICHASLSDKTDVGSRPDSESEALADFGVRSISHRPKLAYNPLAVEQGRQRYLFESSKPSSWSTLGSESDLQQNPQYGASIQLASKPPTQLPYHYQVVHPLPDSLRNDSGLSKICTTQATSGWNHEPHQEPHLMHLPTPSSDTKTGAVNLDQAHLCCYCFTRRAEYLIIDCHHLGPCLECAATKKIEYCGQLNCQTKVTNLLRLFL